MANEKIENFLADNMKKFYPPKSIEQAGAELIIQDQERMNNPSPMAMPIDTDWARRAATQGKFDRHFSRMPGGATWRKGDAFE